MTISELHNFISSYVCKFDELTSKFTRDDKLLLLPKYLSHPCKVIGTISKSHGVAIEFKIDNKEQGIEIRVEHQTIENVVLPRISDVGRVFFTVTGTNHVVENSNLITSDFYERHKVLIDNLTRSTNYVMENVGSFVRIKRGDVKLVDCTLAFVQNGREEMRKIDCLWLFGSILPYHSRLR